MSGQGGAGQGDRPGGTMSPGDEAPAGTPGMEEEVCKECQGAGELIGKPCIACNGTGVVFRERDHGPAG